METVTAYKLAKTNGWDFYTGQTINYRENIGKMVVCPTGRESLPSLCTNTVIHASKNPNDCFVGASIPCSAYKVRGIPVVGDEEKWGFRELEIINEITDLNQLFGWNYNEAYHPINPFTIIPTPVTDKQIQLLRQWASVGASIRASIGASVWASIGASIRDSVWASIRDSVWASIRASIRDSVWASIRDSVGDSVGAYTGSLFPNIKNWRYAPKTDMMYPYQSCVDLWKDGFVASFDGKLWRLHSGLKADIVYEISKEDLLKK
jgi:hypothetical protein